MNHKYCRPLTDRKNILHVFAKHTKSQRGVGVVPDCSSDSSLAKKTSRFGSTCKVKRLKTRKERCRMRGERGQDVHPLYCHRSRREKKTAHSHSSSHNHPLHLPSNENMFTIADRGPESCIITDGRLIGHRGLFNREVKSVDIERLVSDKMKTKLRGLEAAGVHRGCSKSSRAALPSCPPLSPASGSADCFASNLAEENWPQEKPGRTQTGEKAGLPIDCTYRRRAKIQTTEESQENVLKSKTSVPVRLRDRMTDNVSQSNANVSNSTVSCTTPLQSSVHLRGVITSFTGEPELPSSSPTSRGQSVHLRERPHSHAQKGDQQSPRTTAAERPMEQNADPRGREHHNVYSPQQPSKDRKALECHAQSCKADLPLAGPTATTGARSCKDAEDRLQRWAGGCATVAARLCNVVQLPMRCRRNLLAESKEVLLQALQGRHGPQLMENLGRLEQRVRCSTARSEAYSEARGKVCNSDTRADGCTEDTAELEQSRLTTHSPTVSKRRRKQLFPQKVQPHLPDPQHNDTAIQWNQGMFADLAQDPSGEFTKTNSPPLVLDFLPSLSSSPPSFVSSAWGVDTRPQLTQERPFWTARATVVGECINNSGHSPEMCFFSQTKNLENNRPNFVQYSAFPGERSTRDVTHWPRRPADSEISNMPPLLHHPLGHTHLQTHNSIHLQNHNSIHHPPPVLRSYSSDRIYYPHSDRQQRALSPPLPLLLSYPSPDHWSFPRMRLY